MQTKTQNIDGGLTLVQVTAPNRKKSGLWLVKRDETVIGMLEKHRDIESYYGPWKAWAGHGLTARFIGAFYEPRKGWDAQEGMNMNGKNGAIDAIVNAVDQE